MEQRRQTRCGLADLQKRRPVRLAHRSSEHSVIRAVLIYLSQCSMFLCLFVSQASGHIYTGTKGRPSRLPLRSALYLYHHDEYSDHSTVSHVLLPAAPHKQPPFPFLAASPGLEGQDSGSSQAACQTIDGASLITFVRIQTKFTNTYFDYGHISAGTRQLV